MTSVIIPAYNEAERIAATVRAASDLPDVAQVIVVDDGSTDATARVASDAGASVIALPGNRGKGAALAIGAEAAGGDVLLLLDADLGESASLAAELLRTIFAGEADMAIATFPVRPGAGGGFGFVVRLARWGIHRTTGRTMSGPLSGQRALRRAVWDIAGGERVRRAGFGVEVGMTIDALRAGLRVVEVPTAMTHRVTGREWRSTLHRGRQFVAVARALAARIGRARPKASASRQPID